MKKSIKKSSRRKWVVGGVAFFGSIALLTTGFATWVIGANQTSDTDGTNVTVDTAVRNNVSLSIELEDSEVYIGEDLSEVDGEFINGKGEGEPETQKATDFSISMNINLEVGKDAGEFKQIDFTFAYDLNDPEKYPTETNGTDNNKVTVGGSGLTANDWHTANSYTFLDIATSTLLLPTSAGSTSKEGISVKDDGNGNKTYSTATPIQVTIFKWGSFFGNKAPSTYYNDLYKAETVTNSTEDVNAVYSEFEALNKAFNDKIIYITATVK